MSTKAAPTCPSCGKPLTKHAGLAATCAKLRRARAALKAIRTVNTATTAQIRAEYATAIAEAALEMTK